MSLHQLKRTDSFTPFGINFASYTIYGIRDNLEDGKSVSGRSGFDDWSVCVEHCWNGVVALCKEVAGYMIEIAKYVVCWT